MSIEKYVSDPFIKYITKLLINYPFISIIWLTRKLYFIQLHTPNHKVSNINNNKNNNNTGFGEGL